MNSGTTGQRIRRHTVEANGMSFECLRSGTGERLALCLHGFPDDAGSMLPIMAPLAEADFTAIAPYMRGYSPTGPAPNGDYSPHALGQDAIALTRALVDKFDCHDPVLVGHDWGAIAGYAADRRNADVFTRMVTLAVPPGFDALLTAYPRQLLRSWYIWFFQLPRLPHRALTCRNFALIEFLWQQWSPSWEYPGTRIHAVKETFRAENTHKHAIAYYRQTVRPSLRARLNGDQPTLSDTPPVETPTLVLYGTEDGCIGPALFDDAQHLLPDGTIRKIPNAGHFMHHEQPDAVGDAILTWLHHTPTTATP